MFTGEQSKDNEQTFDGMLIDGIYDLTEQVVSDDLLSLGEAGLVDAPELLARRRRLNDRARYDAMETHEKHCKCAVCQGVR